MTTEFYPIPVGDIVDRLVSCSRCAALVLRDDECANLHEHEAFHDRIDELRELLKTHHHGQDSGELTSAAVDRSSQALRI